MSSLQKALFFGFHHSTEVDIQLFNSPRFQSLRCPGSNLEEFVLYDRLRRPPFWNCLGSHVFLTSFRTTQNWRQGKKLASDLTSFPRTSAKSFFFQAIFHFIIFNVIISELEAFLAQNNMSHQPLRKPFGQNLLNGITSRKCGLAAEYCSEFRQWHLNCGFL